VEVPYKAVTMVGLSVWSAEAGMPFPENVFNVVVKQRVLVASDVQNVPATRTCHEDVNIIAQQEAEDDDWETDIILENCFY